MHPTGDDDHVGYIRESPRMNLNYLVSMVFTDVSSVMPAMLIYSVTLNYLHNKRSISLHLLSLGLPFHAPRFAFPLRGKIVAVGHATAIVKDNAVSFLPVKVIPSHVLHARSLEFGSATDVFCIWIWTEEGTMLLDRSIIQFNSIQNRFVARGI